jgi:hypothetical protein
VNQAQSFPASFGRSLTQRLDRLGDTLADLRERLWDEVAHAVGVAVADAVRSVTRALLGTATPHTSSFDRSWSPPPRSSFWNERDEVRNADRFDPYDLDEEDDLLDDEPPTRSPKPSPVRNALALGFIGAAWWLRRGLGSRYALCTVGVGLLCAAVALLVGERLAEAIRSPAPGFAAGPRKAGDAEDGPDRENQLTPETAEPTGRRTINPKSNQ